MSIKILIIEDKLEFTDYLRRGLTYEEYLARFPPMRKQVYQSKMNSILICLY